MINMPAMQLIISKNIWSKKSIPKQAYGEDMIFRIRISDLERCNLPITYYRYFFMTMFQSSNPTGL